ncbi:MAG: polysaccharide deacetylase family protein [Solirubrobacterales bacterium]|nr:polysaccharide deacetylase family protein [Solirubrobacterales bacterium]
MRHHGTWLRTLVFRALRLSLLPVLMRETLQRRTVTLILYHDPEPQRLARHLRALRRSYTFISLRRFVDALREGRLDELPSKALVLTFDDGHIRNRGLHGVLERLGVPATIFLCSSVVGTGRAFWFHHVPDPQALKPMTDAQRLHHLAARGFDELREGRPEALTDEDVRAMQGPVVDFQCHGATHPILVGCDDAKARDEILGSRRTLTARYGLDIFAFSYPNGDYSSRELALVREAGYRCALTVDEGFNTATTDPFALRRIPIDDTDGVCEVMVKASGVLGALRHLAGLPPPGRGRS